MVTHAVSSSFITALARRASDNSNSKQPAEADPNKKKNIRKAKGGIKVPSSHTISIIAFFIQPL